MRRFVSYGPALVVLLTILAMLTGAPALVRRMESEQTRARVTLARQALDDDDILERLNRAVRNVADTVRPSVVHLDVRSSGGPRGTRSAGTGWVYDDRGHIVTNAHVLFGVRSIMVNFVDGRVARAQVVGQPDPYTDVAVIKVDEAAGLLPARRATGEQPHQGDRVFVFGSPFGFKFSMSHGIVSGLGRDPQTANEFGGFTNFIQTDAAVNPGNSGGPLVDIHGRVIGMNVAIATGRSNQGTSEDEGQSAGISFAIPLPTIESVVDQIIEHGSVARGFLGISWSRGAVDYDNRVRAMGVRIGSVTSDGPAATAGLQAGDFITEIGGQPVTGEGVLESVITSYRPGREVQVKAWRAGTAKDFGVVLGEYPRDLLNIKGASAALGRYGLRLADGDAVVAYVLDNSAASEAGLARGNQITKIGEQSIKTAEDVYLSLADQGFLVGHAVRATVVSQDGDGNEQERVITLQPAR